MGSENIPAEKEVQETDTIKTSIVQLSAKLKRAPDPKVRTKE